MGILNLESLQVANRIRPQLLNCVKAEDVENVFLKAKIDDFAIRTELLHMAMQIEKTNSSPDADSDVALNDDKATYEYYRAFFLDGEWRNFV